MSLQTTRIPGFDCGSLGFRLFGSERCLEKDKDPNQDPHPKRSGSMTTGRVTVYFPPKRSNPGSVTIAILTKRSGSRLQLVGDLLSFRVNQQRVFGRDDPALDRAGYGYGSLPLSQRHIVSVRGLQSQQDESKPEAQEWVACSWVFSKIKCKTGEWLGCPAFTLPAESPIRQQPLIGRTPKQKTN